MSGFSEHSTKTKRKAVVRGKSAVVLKAIMDTIIPRGGAFDLGAPDFDLVPRVNEFLDRIEPAIRMSMPFLLFYMEFGTVLYTGRRFTRLPQKKALRFLENMEHSRWAYRRYIILFLKMLTTMTFYEQTGPAEAIGYYHGCHLNPAPSATAGDTSKDAGEAE